MKNILTKLYRGEIDPLAEFQPKAEEHIALCKKNYKDYENFIETLKKNNSDLVNKFIRIMDQQLDKIPFEYSQSFIDGFCLGARIIIEIYQN